MKLSDRVKDKLKKINISSLAFFAISMISITLAWFAYTNTVSSNMNINLKSWNVRITKNNTNVSNTFSININDLYPGAQTFDETYTIHNDGDIAAKISYNIKSFRIFNTEYTTTNSISFAQLERDYPFVLSFTHGSRYLAPGSTSTFNVNCQWPLDSGNNELDTRYGQMAYVFYQQEQRFHNQNSSYQMRSGLELKIEIVISQYIDETNSFATDSWDTIELAVEKGDTSKYNVGDTKTISMDVDGDGTNENYTVRIANKSTNSNCSNENYSQTACGFVVEFQDIITQKAMRETYINVGGYPATNVYTYLNKTLVGRLPTDIQNVLAKTRVISGYGNNGIDTSNFTTTDNLYLLSSEEVYGIDGGGHNFYDTAHGTSQQLDYYSNNGVTYSTNSLRGANLDKAIKQYNSSISWWWLRPADSSGDGVFHAVDSGGYFCRNLAYICDGVAPAFRIG